MEESKKVKKSKKSSTKTLDPEERLEKLYKIKARIERRIAIANEELNNWPIIKQIVPKATREDCANVSNFKLTNHYDYSNPMEYHESIDGEFTIEFDQEVKPEVEVEVEVEESEDSSDSASKPEDGSIETNSRETYTKKWHISLEGEFQYCQTYDTRCYPYEHKSIKLTINGEEWGHNGWEDDGDWIGDSEYDRTDMPLLKAIFQEYGGKWVTLMKFEIK